MIFSLESVIPVLRFYSSICPSLLFVVLGTTSPFLHSSDLFLLYNVWTRIGRIQGTMFVLELSYSGFTLSHHTTVSLSYQE